MSLPFERGMHTAAAVVTADYDVTHAQNIYGKLDHGQAIQIGMHHHIADIAVNKNFTRWKINNLIRRNATIRATNPEILRRLLMRESIEKLRIVLANALRPLRVLLKKTRELIARAHTRNLPARTIGSSSNQMSKSRPTQSMCVLDFQSAPVCSA